MKKKKKTIVFTTALFFLIAAAVVVLQQKDVIDCPMLNNKVDHQEEILTKENKGAEIKYAGSGISAREIKVVSAKNEEIIYRITIDELNQWLEENQHVFEEIPEVVGTLMTPKNFQFFDQTASLAEECSKVSFSVHKYAALTETSFI